MAPSARRQNNMRKKRVYKKYHTPDVVHGRVELGRFINYVMKDGKKSTAEKLVYTAFDKVKEITKEDPLVVFDRAMENVMPLLEVASKRVGGANYQVPREVRPERRFVLALRWIIGAARAKKGKGMADKLAEEIIAASKNEGNAIKKKLDMHRMAEANRAFAHFAR
jgi:small subunit ribosomal protein S7